VPDSPKRDEWTPHFWEGCDFFAWLRILATNRFVVHPRYWWVAAIVTVVSFGHSVLWLIQETLLGHRIRQTPVPRDPLFILGHWRSGTTLLHEILIRDPRHAYATTYECLEPNHFLLTEKLVTRFLPFVMPSRRPMDDMPAGWGRPQEDEFALCMMGQPSPYTHIAFPNRPPADIDYLDFRGVSDKRVRQWSAALAGFFRRVMYLHPGRRLVLKSPPHTARVGVLLRQFPDARFVYISRDRYAVFPSTVRLWKALYRHHTMQVPDGKRTEAFVAECGRRLFAAWERDRQLIPAGRLAEVRYEDLVQSPMTEVMRIYTELGLGGFADAEPAMREYVATWREYKPNPTSITPEVVAMVNRSWAVH